MKDAPTMQEREEFAGNMVPKLRFAVRRGTNNAKKGGVCVRHGWQMYLVIGRNLIGWDRRNVPYTLNKNGRQCFCQIRLYCN